MSNLDVVDLLKPLMREIGGKIQIDNLTERKFDVKSNVLDSTKLQTDTGWKPHVGIREGFTISRDWLARRTV